MNEYEDKVLSLILAKLEGTRPSGRIEIFAMIHAKYCQRCGEPQPASVLGCRCYERKEPPSPGNSKPG